MALIDVDEFEYVILNEDIEVAEHKCKDYESYINGANQFRHQMKNAIRKQPAADVAPKSEVERLEHLRAELSKEIETLKDNNEHLAVMLMEAKSEVAREIFEEIRKRAYSERGFFVVNSDIDDFIAELKKKYTEERE